MQGSEQQVGIIIRNDAEPIVPQMLMSVRPGSWPIWLEEIQWLACFTGSSAVWTSWIMRPLWRIPQRSIRMSLAPHSSHRIDQSSHYIYPQYLVQDQTRLLWNRRNSPTTLLPSVRLRRRPRPNKRVLLVSVSAKVSSDNRVEMRSIEHGRSKLMWLDRGIGAKGDCR